MSVGLIYVGIVRNRHALKLPSGRVDPRIVQIVSELSDAQRTALQWPVDPGTFVVDEFRGSHVFRQVGRYCLLAKANHRRFDSEGIDDVDLEPSSTKIWQDFVKALSPEQSTMLHTFRGGAVWTPTRRYFNRAVPEGATGDPTDCPHCQSPRCSIRHLVVDCPHFSASRNNATSHYALQPGWLEDLPRVATKTGWITKTAAASLDVRAKMQCAVCKIAINIMPSVTPKQ